MSHKRQTPRTGILLRLEPDELAAIDAARGDTPRTQWIVAKAMANTECPRCGLINGHRYPCVQ
jgi:hypothetical protein